MSSRAADPFISAGFKNAQDRDGDRHRGRLVAFVDKVSARGMPRKQQAKAPKDECAYGWRIVEIRIV